MIQKTSLEAYQVLQPELGKQQRVIYQVIIMNPNMSNHDMSRLLDWEINRVTPRVKELRDMGLVISNGTKIDRITKRKVLCWVVP